VLALLEVLAYEAIVRDNLEGISWEALTQGKMQPSIGDHSTLRRYEQPHAPPHHTPIAILKRAISSAVLLYLLLGIGSDGPHFDLWSATNTVGFFTGLP
jgi:hypothetical protein